ncbi:hypothetical protein Dimus_003466 [Dionaea muscipula]
MRFPPVFIGWVRQFITNPPTPSGLTEICVDSLGEEGSSLPYFCVFAIETLSGMFQHRITGSAFRFHWRETLIDFCDLCGLAPSLAKNSVFFLGVKTDVRKEILAILGFGEGTLPVR